MKKEQGFSLTEVIITILIIAILASISGPIYNSYSTKSKVAEGYLLLGTIKDAQLKIYHETGGFYKFGSGSGWKETSYDPTLGIDASANKYYKRFTAGSRYGGTFSEMPGAYGGHEFRAVAFGPKAVGMYYNITTGTKFFI